MILPLGGHWAKFGDNFGCYNLVENDTGTWYVEARILLDVL